MATGKKMSDDKINKIIKQNEEILKKINSIEKSNISMNKRIDKLADQVATLTTDVAGVVKSQSHISIAFEDQEKKLLKHDKNIENLIKNDDLQKREIEQLTKKIKSLEESITKSNTALNDLEQYGRRDMLDLRGIPRMKGENTDDIVIKIASAMELTLTYNHIDVSHRTSNQPEAPIIVKFNSRRTKNMFWSRRRKIFGKTTKDLGIANNGNRIFINESLTAKNGNFFKLCRKKLKNELNYKYVWTNNGIVLARKNDDANSQKLSIRTITDLNNIRN